MPHKAVILSAEDIKKILPHRYPFLLVDKVIELDLENNHIVAQKNFTINEDFYNGHFPQTAVTPGVLIIEAMAQTGGVLIHQKGFTDNIAFLLSVNNAKFRKPIVPGDVAFLHAKGLHLSAKGGKFSVKAVVDDVTVAEAELSFVLRPVTQL